MVTDHVIARHAKIALQFSGGKDSLACLYLMRPYWDKLTVYWLNTGDAYPETIRLAHQVKGLVPHFVEVAGKQPEVVSALGMPTDILPVSGTPLGVAQGGERMQDSYSCCFHSIMAPMYQRMIEDKITLIIRGQKNSDSHKGGLRSGAIENGVEYLYPIEDWTDYEVLQYLLREKVDLPRFYSTGNVAHDCMSCTGWWGNNSTAYLKRYYPEKYYQIQAKLDKIKVSIQTYVEKFNQEVSQ